MIVSECHMLADCRHRNCIVKAKTASWESCQEKSWGENAANQSSPMTDKKRFFKIPFSSSSSHFFFFKTERCSNPLFIVRVVWDWPREIAF